MRMRFGMIAAALVVVWGLCRSTVPNLTRLRGEIVVDCDMGIAPMGSVLSKEVEVWNRTASRWQIGEPRSTCFCLSCESLARVVIPGESVRLGLRLELHQEGAHSYEVKIPLSADPRGGIDVMLVEAIVVRVRGTALGPPWTSPKTILLVGPLAPEQVELDLSVPADERTRWSGNLPVLEQEIAYAMGADAPVIGVSTQGPRLLDGRTTWTMTVRVPEVAVDFEGMVLLKPKLADPKVEFPVASIRWMPAPNDDVALVMRRHGRLVLRRWRGLGDVRIEVDSRPGDGPVDEVDKPRLVSAQIVGDDLHMTAGDALGEDVTKLVWTGGNSTVRVLVVP